MADDASVHLEVGTAQRRRHAAARDEILDAARQLMLEVGPANVSLRGVARRAGFSPASLYTYFASREGLLAALTQQSFVRLRDCLEAVSHDLPADERIVRYGLAYMRFGGENPADLTAILTCTAMGLGAVVDTTLGLRAVHLIGTAFREGIEAGIFPVNGPPLPAMVYSTWALVHGMTSLRNIDLRPVSDVIGGDPEQVLRTHVAGLKNCAGEHV